MLTSYPILSTLIWLPIIGGLLVLFAGRNNDTVAKWLSLATALATFILSIPLWTGFDTGTSSMQFVEQVPWIPAFNVQYYLGVDGLSMPLVLLTTFTQVLVIASAWEVIKERVEQYMGAFLIMGGIMVGVFAALDSILFYVFWEALLIPMFIVIGKWGGASSSLCNHQILPVYLLWFGIYAGCFPVHVLSVRQFLDSGFPYHAVGNDSADSDLPGIPDCLCCQDSDVPGTYLVAGCPR